ncbi:DNA/RNA helicase domain-containing protein [Providencia sp. PROV128]|uniref:DNA/RNA helicase domain-containing protein n=1 Tax=Providencia sp. PROV128 TaxID=2949838 RepID=UPI00234A41FD|nr:DNA/RNA helicase domain-containing protein [Providencia sp. PROV128]
MKDINLISLTQAANTLSEAYFTRYYQYYGIEIKPDEVEVLKNFVKKLGYECVDKRIFNHFFVGYKIPQISKEFDLLRIGDNYIVNIELKRECTEEKIKKQLIQNHYYLKFLNEKIFNFTYELSTDSLYFLKDDNLNVVDFKFLQGILLGQILSEIKNINSLFNPSNYLVSPFNSTDKFLDGQYFLTGQQSNIKRDVVARVNALSEEHFTAVIGSAGTGKTLLVYDIANDLKSAGKRILIIHGGGLNPGQHYLNKQGWDIQPIKQIDNIDINYYDVIFIDEAQRMRVYQYINFIGKFRQSSCKCIFSYDKSQTLNHNEITNNIPDKISCLAGVVTYSLSEKIRTNKEVAAFIRGFFNNKKNDPVLNRGNVSFEYYDNISDMMFFMLDLKSKEWEILQFTPPLIGSSTHQRYLDDSNQKSHGVIGQEFDNVAVIVDPYFNYDKNGDLTYTGDSYYPANKMLFQNMTRTRNQLKILILNNPVILERCLTLLTPPQSQ